MNHIYCTQNAFGNTELGAREFDKIAESLAEAKADGVEVRREMLSLGIVLNDAGERLKELNLDIVFSSPQPLFEENGKLNIDPLFGLFQEAEAVGAWLLKMPLGHYFGMKEELSHLNALLLQFPKLTFTIENDQTTYGGRTEFLETFFLDCRSQEIPAGFTFDVGNPKYVGEDPLAMYERLKTFIRYVHIKHVIDDKGGLRTVPVFPELPDKIDWIISQIPEEVPLAIEYPINVINASQHVANLRKERVKYWQEQVK
ncbi:Sugar phosphate isomerase/epimerase [Fictibacillus solisalsi]|uniref:Sugar phosphate isomerase/epimerase n=1 Tax=Fictibacillus solisalsi TaxID=459525 RepID=A0A1G9WMV3_9BACL|nr:hypothetical protein [Fictibacillus solisalsi]SDM85677.1 Sugar phosphate isomerase/epimerase [Fictibacillus solisalsi]